MISFDILTDTPPPPNYRTAYGPDPNQFGDLRLPTTRGPHPVLINIHGGFWRSKYDLTHAGHLCAALAKEGLATWNLEYRRLGNSGGGWPGTFEDIKSGYRFLRRIAHSHSINMDRLTVMGHSAGGQLALCLAGHEAKVNRAVSLAGVVDLQRAWELKLSNNATAEFMGGPPQLVPDHYREASPLYLNIRASQLIVHGVKDDIVPFDLSKDYVRRKLESKEKVELLSFPEAGHFEVIDPKSEVWPEIQKKILALALSH